MAILGLNIALLLFKTYCTDQGLKFIINGYLFYLLQEMISMNYRVVQLGGDVGSFEILRVIIIIGSVISVIAIATHIHSDIAIYVTFCIYFIFCQISAPKFFHMSVLSIVIRIGGSLFILCHLMKCVRVKCTPIPVPIGLFYVINVMWTLYVPIQLLVLIIPQIIIILHLRVNGKLDIFCGEI